MVVALIKNKYEISNINYRTSESGKTSTIKNLIKLYNGKTLTIMKAGWNEIFLSSLLRSLRLRFFCIPASPTETNKKLSVRFLKTIPEVLVIAEQACGANYPDTIASLTSNGYHILRYDIFTTNGPADWERFNTTNMTVKLDNRANQIVADIKLFFKSRGIV